MKIREACGGCDATIEFDSQGYTVEAGKGEQLLANLVKWREEHICPKRWELLQSMEAEMLDAAREEAVAQERARSTAHQAEMARLIGGRYTIPSY